MVEVKEIMKVRIRQSLRQRRKNEKGKGREERREETGKGNELMMKIKCLKDVDKVKGKKKMKDESEEEENQVEAKRGAACEGMEVNCKGM